MVVCTYDPVLPRFYAGRDVFITGATGFMGKVLVERLLSTCPDIGQLYLLMRDKRGQSADKRLAQLKQSQVFDNIRARAPLQLEKLMVVAGDVSLPLLGLHAEAIAQLIKVSVVFHNAATIKFWEPLEVAVSHNVTSVISLMDLCDKLPSLEALVHVSTAFTKTELRHIEERVYPAPVELSRVKDLIGALPTEIINEITPKYIHPKPNTYVFTKALAEVAVDQRRDRKYSVAIFRPSIVVSSDRAPMPGWIEGLAGASGAIVGSGQGLLRVYRVNLDTRAEVIPVDVAIDNMIAVAWETATDKLKETRVYYCGSQENPLLWRKFKDWVVRLVVEYPFDNVSYYPYTICCGNEHASKILEVVLQTFPLHVADFIVKICCIKTPINLKKASQRLREMIRVLAFFACQEWTFSTDNLQRLRKRLHDTDGHIYHLNINDVNWEEHTRNFVRGVRKYILQQKDDTLPLARKRIDRLRLIHNVVLLIFLLLCYKLIVFFVQRVFIPIIS